MQTSESQAHDQIGSLLVRLLALKRRVEAFPLSPRASGRVPAEARTLAEEIERTLMDLRQLAARYVEAQETATLACRRAELLFAISPAPCFLLERGGAILDANPAAVRVLSVSRRHLIGRPFHLFLGSDRDEFLMRLKHLNDAEDDQPQRWNVSLRPRERSLVQTTLAACMDTSDRVLLVLLPLEAPMAAAGPEPDLRMNEPRRGARATPRKKPIRAISA